MAGITTITGITITTTVRRKKPGRFRGGAWAGQRC